MEFSLSRGCQGGCNSAKANSGFYWPSRKQRTLNQGFHFLHFYCLISFLLSILRGSFMCQEGECNTAPHNCNSAFYPTSAWESWRTNMRNWPSRKQTNRSQTIRVFTFLTYISQIVLDGFFHLFQYFPYSTS